MGRLLAAGVGRAEPRLPVFGRAEQELRRQRPLVRLAGAGLQRRRQIPVLRLRPRLQPDLRRPGIQLHLQGYGEDLCRPAGPRHAVAVQAQERRGRGEEGGRTQGRREEGRRDQGRYRRAVGPRRGSARGAGELPQPRIGRLDGLLRPHRQQGRQAGAADVRPRPAQRDGPGLRGRLRDFRRRQEDDRGAGQEVRHHRPAERPGDGGRAAQPVRPGDEARPASGVGADLQRELAAGARFLLRPRHARRRLAGRPREVLRRW